MPQGRTALGYRKEALRPYDVVPGRPTTPERLESGLFSFGGDGVTGPVESPSWQIHRPEYCLMKWLASPHCDASRRGPERHRLELVRLALLRGLRGNLSQVDGAGWHDA
jgi:hypothetical protein